MVKANDEKIDLVFVNAANDGVSLVPIHQVSSNLNAFGQTPLPGPSFVIPRRFRPIFAEGLKTRRITDHPVSRVGRKLFREGNRLRTCIECRCQLNRRGQGAASLWRFIIRYRNISKH
jgi:hypothetical protein